MPNNALLIGHSLVGTVMPQMLNTLLTRTAVGIRADAQVINGAALSYQWANGAFAQGVNARTVLPSGDYGTLVLTEAIPLAGHIQWSDTYGAARNYYRLATAANPQTRVLVYETWHEMAATEWEWRARLTSDLAVWQTIVDSMNAIKTVTAPVVAMVPAGQAMARLYDTIATGDGAGLWNIRSLFADNIHLNDMGNYFIALTQYSSITGRNVVGLSQSFSNEWGQAYSGWTLEQERLFQHVAWEAAALAPGAILNTRFILPTLVIGTGGNDYQIAGSGEDRLYGGLGNDTLGGGKGNDLITGGAGNDMLYGANGHDFIYATSGNDSLYGGNNNDYLFGGDGAEFHDGGAGFDFIYAGNGADTLNGGRDGDNLFGGGGNDILNAGSGIDVISGGTGADAFVFALGNQSDTITDFNPWQGDRLQLSRALWANEALTTQQVLDRYAYVNNGAVEINFWNGDSVTLRGFNSLTGFAGCIDLI